MKKLIILGLMAILLTGFGSRFGLGHDANVKRAIKADTHIMNHFYDVDNVDGQAHMGEAGYQLNKVFVESKMQFTSRLAMESSLKEVQQTLINGSKAGQYVQEHIDQAFIKMAHARGNQVTEYFGTFAGELLAHTHTFLDIKVDGRRSDLKSGRCYIEYDEAGKPVSMLLPVVLMTEFPGMGAMAVRVSYLVFGERNMAIYQERLTKYQNSGNVQKLLQKDFITNTFLPE